MGEHSDIHGAACTVADLIERAFKEDPKGAVGDSPTAVFSPVRAEYHGTPLATSSIVPGRFIAILAAIMARTSGGRPWADGASIGSGATALIRMSRLAYSTAAERQTVG